MSVILDLTDGEKKLLTELAEAGLRNAELAIVFHQVENDNVQLVEWGLKAATWRKLLSALDWGDISQHRREIHSVDDIQL